MVWLFEDGKLLDSVEVSDFRCLLWVDKQGRQATAVGAKVPVDQGTCVQLVVPLATKEKSSCVVHTPELSTEIHCDLERCATWFPQVVHEMAVMKKMSRNMQDEDEEDDDDDEEDLADEQDPVDIAREILNEQRQERESRPLLSFTSLEILTRAETCQKVGLSDDSSCILDKAWIQVESTGDSEGMLFVVGAATALAPNPYFAMQFAFNPVSDVEDRFIVPISNTPRDDKKSSDSECSYLEPVTRRMDHLIYSLGAARESGLYGAGKNPAEMLKDMKLRHASGSCTYIVPPLHHAGEPLRTCCKDTASQFNAQHFRLRKIVGPFDTTHDLLLVRDSSVN